MDKKKETEVPKHKSLSEVGNLFKKMKSNTGFTLKSSPYSNVKDWISTGSYALNILLSGRPDGGVPTGRAVAFAGESGVGKSFLTTSTVKEGQAKDYYPIYIDTENAIDSAFAENIGCDVENFWHESIHVIEEARNFVVNKVGEILQENPDAKVILVMDSLGNFSSNKDKEDIKKDKTNADMGSRAKVMKDMLKNLIHFCAIHNIPYIFTNHTYKDVANATNPIYAKTVMSGGQQPVYMASAVAMASAKDIKDANGKPIGRVLKVKTTKNRFCPPMSDGVEILISFKNGLNPYFGLARFAVEAGLMEQTSKTVGKETYVVPHLNNKKFSKLALYSNKNVEEVFNDDIMKKIKEYCEKTYTYSNKFLPDHDLEDLEIDESGDSED